MQKFKGADGLRGIACLIVLGLHNTGMYMGSSGIYTQGMEKYGVWLFFILSAFLLSFKFINEQKPINYLLFYFISRSIRIIPAFFICAIFYWYTDSYDLKKLYDILTFSGTYGHLWTIPVEFKFYFLLPFIAILSIVINDRFGTPTYIYTLILFLFIHQIYFPYSKTAENTIDLLWYLPVFIFGIAISIVYNKYKLDMPDKWRDLMGFIILALIISVAPGIIKEIYHLQDTVYLMNKFTPLGILLSIFILLFIDAQGLIGKFVSSKIFRVFGKYSFSIYLYHFKFLFLGYFFAGTPFVSMIFSVFFGILTGVIMYYLVEHPCNRLRARIESVLLVKFPSLAS